MCFLFLPYPRCLVSPFRVPRLLNLSVMHSLMQEIQGFSKGRLKEQTTCVTTVTGRKLLEKRREDGEVMQVEELDQESTCGFVEDTSLDLQVGVVRHFLLLGNIFFNSCIKMFVL